MAAAGKKQRRRNEARRVTICRRTSYYSASPVTPFSTKVLGSTLPGGSSAPKTFAARFGYDKYIADTGNGCEIRIESRDRWGTQPHHETSIENPFCACYGAFPRHLRHRFGSRPGDGGDRVASAQRIAGRDRGF